jgi:hypothetical protein
MLKTHKTILSPQRRRAVKQPYEVPSLWRPASQFFLLFLVVVVVLSAPPAARGDVCSIDEMPAATLLLPYFEVDPGNASGLTTLFSVNNAGPAAVVANVQLWTDVGVPTLGFQVYLTGYDVQTINLRDVFNGSLPQTAPAGQDPQDTISPKGLYSQDINFPGCSQLQLPYPPLPAPFVAHLRAAHSGQFSAILNGCAGMDHGDGRLRGYVTVDTVSDCTLHRAGDVGYFGAGGVVTNQNVLWGDVIYLDPANQYSDGDNLVRIKAFPDAFAQGGPTFYGRYVGGSGADLRQPLPLDWGSRYVDGGAFSGGTDLIVWQDSERAVHPFACGTLPAGFPLRHSQITIFDEQEQAVLPPPIFPRPPDLTENAFPAEANKVHIGGASFPVPYAFGWTFLDLRAPGGFPQPSLRQSWVATSLKAQGQYSVGFSATPLGTVCDQGVPSVGLAAGAAAEVRP